MKDEYFQMCKNIAELIKDIDSEQAAYIIQFFCDDIANGETPIMAFVNAKNHITDNRR